MRLVAIACVVCAAACGRIGFDAIGGDDGAGIDAPSIPPGAFTRRIDIHALNIDVPAGYTVSVTFDHAALVAAGKSLADGSDVGIVRGATEIDRVLDAGSQWNSATTRVWFRTASLIPALTTNTEHVLVYGRGPRVPAQDPSAVFIFWDDFETGLGKWQVGAGNWSVATAISHRGTQAVVMNGPLPSANRWIVANGVDESDVIVEAYWWITRIGASDLGQGLRSGGAAAPRHYLINLETTNGLVLAKDTAAGFSTVSAYVAAPPTNAWVRMSVAIMGPQASVRLDELQIIPTNGSITVGTELPTGSVSLYAYAVETQESWAVDDLIVRRYVDPEPTTSLGPESQ